MKRQNVGVFAGAALIGLIIIDWVRARLFIARVSGYMEGARVVLKSSNELKEEEA